MKRIEISRDIIINKPAEEVFAFISDGNNDPLWREEVDKMDVQGDIAPGTDMVEYSTFFHFFHTETTTEIVEVEAPNRIVYETHPEDIWLRSIREVEAIGETKSKFTYNLAYDEKLLKQLTPILPPRSWVEGWYGGIIEHYLENARKLIEDQ